MATDDELVPTVNAALARFAAEDAKEARRGHRDAREVMAKLAVKAAGRTASPAGLAALFPALKIKKA